MISVLEAGYMDHSEAIRIGAAEKYLLGELPPDQREQFEEHYFSCHECATEVRLGAVFVDNARAILREEPAMQTVLKPVPQRQGWLGWLKPAWALAAALILVGVICYQNFVTIPQLKQGSARPEALMSFSLMTAGSRGGNATVIRPLQGRPFGIYVDIPATQSFQYYTVQVRTASRQFEVQVTPEQAKDTVQVLIPAGALDAGKAELVIAGHASENGPVTEIVRDPFEIQYQ